MEGGKVMGGVTLAAILLFLIAAWAANWVAAHYGPLAHKR